MGSEEDDVDDDDDKGADPLIEFPASFLSKKSSKIPTQKVRKAEIVKTPERQESLATGVRRQRNESLPACWQGECGRGDRRVILTPRAEAGKDDASEEGPRRSKGERSATELRFIPLLPAAAAATAMPLVNPEMAAVGSAALLRSR